MRRHETNCQVTHTFRPASSRKAPSIQGHFSLLSITRPLSDELHREG